jgi:hypothetical protein
MLYSKNDLINGELVLVLDDITDFEPFRVGFYIGRVVEKG